MWASLLVCLVWLAGASVRGVVCLCWPVAWLVWASVWRVPLVLFGLLSALCRPGLVSLLGSKKKDEGNGVHRLRAV